MPNTNVCIHGDKVFSRFPIGMCKKESRKVNKLFAVFSAVSFYCLGELTEEYYLIFHHHLILRTY